MKRYLITLLLVLSPVMSSAKEIVVIAVLNLPPLVTISEGKVGGLLIDYLQSRVFSQTPYEVKWTNLPFIRVKESLKRGIIHGFVPFIVTEERKNYVNWTSRPLLEMSPGVCFKKRRFSSVIMNPSKKLRISVVGDSPPTKELLKSSHELIPIAGANYATRAIKMLELDHIDGAFHPIVITLLGSFQKRKNLNGVQCEYYKSSHYDMRLAFSKLMAPERFKIIDQAYSKAYLKEPFDKYLEKNLNPTLFSLTKGAIKREK